jgi:hypothetical protein
MKIYKDIFNKIISLENLFLAWDEFKKDKKNKKDVLRFELGLEENIFELHRDLKYKRYKHGLLSKEVLLEGEDESVLVEVGKRLRAELEPQTELELVLVDRITANVWRLRRVMQIEREMMNDDCNPKFDDKKNLGEALSYDFANNDTYGKLVRYEASIEKGIFKALHELQRIQSARNGEKPSTPVAIDIDV